MWRYVRLARPHFLLGGAVLFALGARSAGLTDGVAYAIGQTMVTSIQLTAQLVNEHADAGSDAAIIHRTLFSGGSGMIPSGRVSARSALVGAVGSSTLAVAMVVAMAWISVAAMLAGIAALGVAWSYSARPVRLLDTGWGEAAASLVVAGLVPLTGAWSQGTASVHLWWSIAALVPLHAAMVLCFELPDLDVDRATAKRVLSVRVGRSAAHAVIGACAAVSAGLLALAARLDGDASHRLMAVAVVAIGAAVTTGGITTRRWSVVTTAAVGGFVVVAGLLVAGT